MPDPAQDAADEEAEIQAMLLSLLTNRADEPVAETSELGSARAGKVSEVMADQYLGGQQQFRVPDDPYEYGSRQELDAYQDKRAKAEQELRWERYQQALEEKQLRENRIGDMFPGSEAGSQPDPPPMHEPQMVPDPMIYRTRDPEPVRESSPLDQRRGAKAVEMMDSDFWEGEPMYYSPASALNFTDENVHGEYLNRLARDAEFRGVRKNPWGREPEFREAWHEGVLEEDRHPDWAFPTDTPPWWPERKLKELK